MYKYKFGLENYILRQTNLTFFFLKLFSYFQLHILTLTINTGVRVGIH